MDRPRPLQLAPERMLYQATTLFGAVLILGAYAATQRGTFPLISWQPGLMNLVGGAALTAAALARSQWGFVLLEGAWTLVAAASLVTCYRRSRA
jgi:hypothetical protein